MLDPASILVFVLLVTVAGTTLVLRRALRTTGRARAGRAARRLPPIVMIRPTKGRDPGLRANARAALAQRYPGPLETLFVLDDTSDPAYPVIRDVVAAHGPGARLVLSGPPTDGRTGKLHAMIRGLEEARLDAPLVCFADSDTRPDPDLLADLAAAVMEHEDVGAAFAPVVCVDEPALGGDVGYGLLLDGLYGPQAALATDRRGSLPFIMGQTMVLRRSALAEAGGLEATEGELVDDMHIGARLEEAGYRNVLVSHPLPVVQRGLAWTEFLSVATRWFIYSRTGIPFWPFNLPSLVWATVFFGGLAGAGAALAMGAHAAAPGLALCSVSVLVAIQWLRRLQGAAPLPPRLWWALAASFAVLPGIYLRAWLARSVEWRGRVYSLDESGRLAAESSVREP